MNDPNWEDNCVPEYDRRLTYEIFFDSFDRAFYAGDFRAVDWFISGLDPEGLATEAIIGCLTMGWHARDQLNELVPFFLRAEPVVVARLGKTRAENLLKNRDPRGLCGRRVI